MRGPKNIKFFNNLKKADYILNIQGTAKDEVAVVIDPYLAYQLRPHQVEGVQFLYSSVMGFRGSVYVLFSDS